MEEILNRGLPYVSGPQWLAENVLQDKWVLAVAGTHGKTTTTSMLAWILEDAGMKPGFLIGGVPQNFGISARLGTTPIFCHRGRRIRHRLFRQALQVRPLPATYGILNNLEFDHADIFPDLTAIETQFHHLVRTVPGQGRIVANGAEESLERVLARGCWSEVERFNADHGWLAAHIDADGSFDVFLNGQTQGRVQWPLLGAHNRSNALAAIAAARHVGVPPRAACEALGRFENVKRRMEVRGTVNGITVYDDFAHHPTAIAATIAGLRAKVGSTRILAVLEPRSNTMKLGVMKAALSGSLLDADCVFCYAANLGWDAKEALTPLGEIATVLDDLDELVETIAAEARPGDHVLVMSNGGFGGIHQKLLERLAA